MRTIPLRNKSSEKQQQEKRKRKKEKKKKRKKKTEKKTTTIPHRAIQLNKQANKTNKTKQKSKQKTTPPPPKKKNILLCLPNNRMYTDVDAEINICSVENPEFTRIFFNKAWNKSRVDFT